MIELGIVALLIEDTGVSALVEDRIYPTVLPPVPTFPAITYEMMPSKEAQLLDGTISEQTLPIRIKCHGLSYLDALNVAGAVHNLLDTYQGKLPDGTVSQVTERGSGQDFYLADQKVYGKVCLFTFFY